MQALFNSASSFKELAEKLPQHVLLTFNQALVLGHWPDGRMMTSEQKRLCIEAIAIHANRPQVNPTTESATPLCH